MMSIQIDFRTRKAVQCFRDFVEQLHAHARCSSGVYRTRALVAFANVNVAFLCYRLFQILIFRSELLNGLLQGVLNDLLFLLYLVYSPPRIQCGERRRCWRCDALVAVG